MTNVSYAPTNSGPFASAIGWVNFPDISLPPTGQPITITNTLRDGSIISFSLTNNPIEGASAHFSGKAAPIDKYSPFGNAKPYGGYQGILGNTILYTWPITDCCNSYLDFNLITLKDPNGIAITDYTIILADGEHTDYSEKSCGVFESGAFITYSTNGTPWTELGRLGIGTSPSYSGLETSTVFSEGQYVTLDIKNFQSLLLATNSPTKVSALINTTKGGGIAFGVIFPNTNNHPNLTLMKETCTCKACVNQLIPYTLKVKNTSLINATTIVVKDSYPLGVAIASTTISTGTISNNNSVLTWTIPSLAGGESSLAMIFAVPVDDFCYNKNKFLTSTAQIVSYYPPNPSNLSSDTSIVPINCFCCNCKN